MFPFHNIDKDHGRDDLDALFRMLAEEFRMLQDLSDPGGPEGAPTPTSAHPGPSETAPGRARSPMVTITSDPEAERVTVIIEPVPHLAPEGILVDAAGERLHIEAEGAHGMFREEILLGTAVDEERLEVQYHDDVILVTAPMA